MQNVLILCRDMAPFCTSPGGFIRVLTFTNFLKRKGFNTSLLCAEGAYVSMFGLGELVKEASPIYVPDGVQMRRTIWMAENKGHSTEAERFSFVKQLLKVGKSFVSQFLIPDQGVLSTFKFYRESKRIIDQNDIDTLLNLETRRMPRSRITTSKCQVMSSTSRYYMT